MVSQDLAAEIRIYRWNARKRECPGYAHIPKEVRIEVGTIGQTLGSSRTQPGKRHGDQGKSQQDPDQ